MPIVSISQASQSGAVQLASELHRRLGFPMVRQEDASATAARYGVSDDDLHRGLDMPANFFERFTRKRERYVLAMQAALGRLFEGGDGIYCGLAGQFLLAGLCNVFKVCLVAPPQARIASAMAQLSLSREEAVSYLERADERRNAWGRQLFNRDLDDPDLYDLVVNLEHMSLDTAADLVAGILQRKTFPADCGLQFANFALQRRVQAALHFNSPFDAGLVDVKVDDGVVELAGGKGFEGARVGIVDFVSRIRGVKKVVTAAGEVTSVDATLDLDLDVSSLDTKARDVMLPPASYPHCDRSCTIRDAIVALSASAVKLGDGHITLPRYVLVLDGDGLLGIVSRRELLRGLIPQLRTAERSAAEIRKLVPFGGRVATDLLIRWTSLFSPAALEAATQPVTSIMAPIRGAVQVDDSLSTVISTMLRHDVDLVPVLEGPRVAGLVLMTNIFDIVAQYVMEHGAARS